jgi:hypothetical protein
MIETRLRVILALAILFVILLALTLALMPSTARAQIQPGPNLTPSGRPFLYAPRAGYLGPPVAVHRAENAPFPLVYPRTGGVSIPVPAGPVPVVPPPAPPPSPPPLAYAPPPLPPPLGWVFAPYTACVESGCETLFVSVPGADALNVRTVPNGPVTLALVNGTPLIPLQQDGRWALVAAACSLDPTGLWSWTAGVSVASCL